MSDSELQEEVESLKEKLTKTEADFEAYPPSYPATRPAPNNSSSSLRNSPPKRRRRSGPSSRNSSSRRKPPSKSSRSLPCSKMTTPTSRSTSNHTETALAQLQRQLQGTPTARKYHKAWGKSGLTRRGQKITHPQTCWKEHCQHTACLIGLSQSSAWIKNSIPIKLAAPQRQKNVRSRGIEQQIAGQSGYSPEGGNWGEQFKGGEQEGRGKEEPGNIIHKATILEGEIMVRLKGKATRIDHQQKLRPDEITQKQSAVPDRVEPAE